MGWNTTAPNTDLSVSSNGPILQENTDYIKATMNVDHIWDTSATTDGMHQFVQMPESETGGTPDNPVMSADADGMAYYKRKTSGESPDNEDVQPFFQNVFGGASTPAYMQLLGIRAMAYIETTGAITNTIHYNHNISSITGGTGGVFVATFGTGAPSPLPSDKYLFLGSAQFQSITGHVSVRSADLATSKTVNEITFVTVNETGVISAPKYVWFVVFGG